MNQHDSKVLLTNAFIEASTHGTTEQAIADVDGEIKHATDVGIQVIGDVKRVEIAMEDFRQSLAIETPNLISEFPMSMARSMAVCLPLQRQAVGEQCSSRSSRLHPRVGQPLEGLGRVVGRAARRAALPRRWSAADHRAVALFMRQQCRPCCSFAENSRPHR